MSETTLKAAPTQDMQAVLDAFAKFNAPPLETTSAEMGRQLPTMTDATMGLIGQNLMKRTMTPFPEPVEKTEHKLIPGSTNDILVRIYTPSGEGPFPITVYFHGGGWVIANLDTYDASCRSIANMAKCIVVSVAYRQAPEHKFPAPLEDCFTAYKWVRANATELNGDPTRIAIAGESAGGNMATVVCQMLREKGEGQPLHQLLIYPVTQTGYDTPSMHEQADAKPLNKKIMVWFWDKYLNGEQDKQNPHVGPLQADLKDLAPATIITAELDPLCSDGEIYADKLREAGVDVEHQQFKGVTHEFFGLKALVSEAMDANELAAKRLKEAFGI